LDNGIDCGVLVAVFIRAAVTGAATSSVLNFIPLPAGLLLSDTILTMSFHSITVHPAISIKRAQLEPKRRTLRRKPPHCELANETGIPRHGDGDLLGG
jgi:hypothetical protein